MIKPFRARNPIAVGLVGATVMIALFLGALNWDRLPLVAGGQTYTAEFAEAAGLAAGDDVLVAGVEVGEVTDVALDTDRVVARFSVEDDVWVGDKSVAAITIKTALGQKSLSLDPLGSAELDPGERIPMERSVTPFDINDAFDELAVVFGEIDTEQLAEAFDTMAETFSSSTPEDVRASFEGLSDFSRTISERDEELAELLSNTNEISGTLAEHNEQFEALIGDGSTLLAELEDRRDAIGELLSGAREMSSQLSGLVEDNEEEIGPMLEQLDRVTVVLERNQRHLNESLELAGPFYRMMGDTVSARGWIDSYICGLVDGGDASCVPPRSGGG
ncbi:phospholipid/cholesterol/gamma-HCH transport system substrate-binding protein [Haloechinothrix alba]|uniref:Phospholipid/cholesterol/gamma-HCH transport system substrate-binding protein n=1 Tax=Haloechinothrix alba TaxID=664784 RepID=A0A238VG45_9PSEU|nr:MCE family protein [Haloechinothrix alba]SNR33138.1 phospholipid/cholesterol/gamma-HCH transport system substrate-binding protein [Haloechinothrix alba]